MPAPLEQLVRETMEVTGAAAPNLLEADAPVLADDALAGGDEANLYLVGLIGGKEVGKSALVNALVGKAITAVTSHGAGTETVIAYAHTSQEPALRRLLEREVPGQFSIKTHQIEPLRRQVLLDLPDIDSRYASHLKVTRTMLRHMLYPVWVGSLEKYADQQPQQMLARVAEGNAPANFVFCLNKVDQLPGYGGGSPLARPPFNSNEDDAEPAVVGKAPTPWELELDGDDAPADALPANPPTLSLDTLPARGNGGAIRTDPLSEVRADYAERIARTLTLGQPPRVYLISAKNPTRFDLPALRELLSRQKSADAVRQSKQSAAARQERALLAWLDAQELPLRTQRLEQLQRDAEELLGTRVGVPLLERIVPRLLDDPSTRLSMADDILQERVARWPVVKLVHTLLQPLFVLLRSSVSRSAMPMQSTESMVDSVMKDSGESVASLVQAAFAQLRQSQPAIAPLYPHNKLWEDMGADLAARNFKQALAGALQRQRTAARERLMSGRGLVGAPARWLLTIGALLWFPIIQPVLSRYLADPDASAWRQWRHVAGLLVAVLGVDYLLKSVGFLIIYYIVLWLALRWNTQRKVSRLLNRWRAADYPDPTVNLATQTIQWLEGLTAPIRSARDRMQSLADRRQALGG